MLVRPAKPLEDANRLHLLVLDVLILQKFGPGALLWDSPVLYEALTKAFGSEPGHLTWERIQAARCMHAKSSFWVEWEVFEKCCAAIVGQLPVFTWSQPPEAEDIAVAVTTASRIDTTYSFEPEVKRYMAAACLHDGVWYTEAPLEPLVGPYIQEYLDAQGIARNPEAVRDQLRSQKDIDLEVSTEVGVQANRTLGIREALLRYDTELAQQMSQIPSILGTAE